jgi:anti-sigma-K factor RskA
LPHLMTNDDEIDGLAGEYVLGSLDPIERKEVDVRRKVDVALDGAISAWEKRLGPLSDLLPAIAPPPHLFLEVTNQLGRQRKRQEIGTRTLVRPWRWQALAAGACALAACLAIITVWLSPKSSASPARLVAELERSANPADRTNPTVRLGFVVYFDLRASTMIVSPLAVPPGSRRDYQLWLVPEGSAPPISLGVIPLAEPSMSPWLATYAPKDLVHARLAVSLEPAGGSPKGIPTGPTMFVGALVQTMP